MTLVKEVTEEILALEDEMWRANREGDADFYQRVVREDALVVSRYGVMGKEQIVPTIRANQNPYLKTELSDRQVRVLTEDSALVTYKAAVTVLVNGEEQTFEVLATSIHVREGGTWRSAFHQQTAL